MYTGQVYCQTCRCFHRTTPAPPEPNRVLHALRQFALGILGLLLLILIPVAGVAIVAGVALALASGGGSAPANSWCVLTFVALAVLLSNRNCRC